MIEGERTVRTFKRRPGNRTPVTVYEFDCARNGMPVGRQDRPFETPISAKGGGDGGVQQAPSAQAAEADRSEERLHVFAVHANQRYRRSEPAD